ncbi:DUF2199 domain-containing protein [Priestia megaterium]|nr:DUF2199 domain-containing protein [Priestia megaterium]
MIDRQFDCLHPQQALAMSYGSEAPVHYYDIPETERKERVELTSDLCVIDEEHYFIRGCIEIPVLHSNEIFSWDVWVSLSEHNFDRTIELWNTKGGEGEDPYFGWLSTSLPGYPDTVNLKTNVHTREVGIRPFIELEPTDHPLAIEQRTGIAVKRVAEIKEIVTRFNQEDDFE